MPKTILPVAMVVKETWSLHSHDLESNLVLVEDKGGQSFSVGLVD